MTDTSSNDEATIRELKQKIALLEQGLKQSAHVRELWGKAVSDLKATKAELKESLAKLTEAHEELERKNASLEELNTRLQEEMALRERMEVELRLAQKLESIGQLAAGLAHEINTPIQYIGDNTLYLGSAFKSYQALLNSLKPLAEGGVEDVPIEDVLEVMKAEGLDDLADDVPDAIAETLEGVSEVAAIVASMKEFSSQGGQEKAPVDINHALEVTVTVARGEWKSVAEVEMQLEEELPPVYAIGPELNQVFLNLLVNASQAICEARGTGDRESGLVTITTLSREDGVTIQVADNGTGIPDDIKDHIFDPFFTTRDVGGGTGQGLSIARSIVVDHHHGTIDVESEPGVGTTFTIWIPTNGASLET